MLSHSHEENQHKLYGNELIEWKNIYKYQLWGIIKCDKLFNALLLF